MTRKNTAGANAAPAPEAAETQAAANAAPELAKAADEALLRMHLGGKLLRVRTIGQEGRRRGGRAFSKDVVEIAADELDLEQSSAILSDPLLAVEVVDSED